MVDYHEQGFSAFPVFRRIYEDDDRTLRQLSDYRIERLGFRVANGVRPVLTLLTSFNTRCLADASVPTPQSKQQFAGELQDRLPASSGNHVGVMRERVSYYKERGVPVMYSRITSPLVKAEFEALTDGYAAKLTDRERTALRDPRIIWGEVEGNPKRVQHELEQMLPEVIILEPVTMPAN